MPTFATFNLRNLQLADAPVYGNDSYYSKAEYAEKRDWIAARLRAIDADVIGFQELFSVAALKDCFAAAGLAEDYDLAARDAPSSGRVQVALAARKGMLQPGWAWHERFPESFALRKAPPRRASDPNHGVTVEMDSFSRPILEATVQPDRADTPPIRVLVAHLKSKRPIRLDAADRRRFDSATERTLGEALSLIRRGAEAAALRTMLHGAMRDNDQPFVVLGDLNDDYLSVTTTIVTNDPSYKLFLASRVGARESISGDLGLYSTQMLQEYRSLRNVHYTHIYRNKMEVLDHILVSEQFYDHSPKRIWAFREMRFWNDHLEEADRNRLVGDHAVVTARFDHAPLVEAGGDLVAVETDGPFTV